VESRVQVRRNTVFGGGPQEKKGPTGKVQGIFVKTDEKIRRGLEGREGGSSAEWRKKPGNAYMAAESAGCRTKEKGRTTKQMGSNNL